MTTGKVPIRNWAKRLIRLPAIDSITKGQKRSETLRCRLNNSHRLSASVLRQHAEHATVLHGDRTWGAAGRRFPVSEAGDAEKRQHVWVGAGVNFRRASDKPSQGKKEIVPAVFRYLCFEETVTPNSVQKSGNLILMYCIITLLLSELWRSLDALWMAGINETRHM